MFSFFQQMQEELKSMKASFAEGFKVNQNRLITFSITSCRLGIKHGDRSAKPELIDVLSQQKSTPERLAGRNQRPARDWAEISSSRISREEETKLSWQETHQFRYVYDGICSGTGLSFSSLATFLRRFFLPMQKKKCSNRSCFKKAEWRCRGCSKAYYCSKTCQEHHWAYGHDSECDSDDWTLLNFTSSLLPCSILRN